MEKKLKKLDVCKMFNYGNIFFFFINFKWDEICLGGRILEVYYNRAYNDFTPLRRNCESEKVRMYLPLI